MNNRSAVQQSVMGIIYHAHGPFTKTTNPSEIADITAAFLAELVVRVGLHPGNPKLKVLNFNDLFNVVENTVQQANANQTIDWIGGGQMGFYLNEEQMSPLLDVCRQLFENATQLKLLFDSLPNLLQNAEYIEPNEVHLKFSSQFTVYVGENKFEQDKDNYPFANMTVPKYFAVNVINLCLRHALENPKTLQLQLPKSTSSKDLFYDVGKYYDEHIRSLLSLFPDTEIVAVFAA